MREVSRQRLRVENGHYLYAEANAFVANRRGEVLLAGIPTMLMEEQPDGSFTGVAKDSILGAVIAPDGTARGVPAPIDARTIHGIRVAAREDGGWDAVFAEVPANASHRARTDSASRFWYGVYDGSRWSVLEQIPLPEQARLSSEWTSQLLRRGSRLSWALRPVLGSGRNNIVILHRDQGAWSHEIVPTRHEVDMDMDMSYSDSLGLLLAVVQPDTSLPSDGNSLFLWAERPRWRSIRRLVHGGGEGRANRPSIVRSRGGLVVSWETPVEEGGQGRRELRAMIGDLEAGGEPAIALDPDVSIWAEMPPLGGEFGPPVWVTHHESPSEGLSEIRFAGVSGRVRVELGRIPNPYYIRMTASMTGPLEFLVTGMEYTGAIAFSLLLRARMECER